MRKVFFTVAIATTILIATSSCSNNEGLETSNPESELFTGGSQTDETIQLKNQIQKLGENYFGYKAETRGGWWSNFWNNVKRVVKADLKGAVNGWNGNKNLETAITRSIKGDLLDKVENAIVEGISASIETIINKPETDAPTPGNPSTPGQTPRANAISGENKPAVNDSVQAMSNLILCDNNVKATTNDSIGYYHNAIIYNMVQKDPEVFNRSLSSEEMAKRILTSSSAVMKLDPSLADNPDLIRQVASNLNKYEAMDDATIAGNDLDEDSPEMRHVMELIDTYLSAFSSIEDFYSHTEYTNEVYKIVDNSNLDDFTKENFKIALSVAFASSKLWNF